MPQGYARVLGDKNGTVPGDLIEEPTGFDILGVNENESERSLNLI